MEDLHATTQAAIGTIIGKGIAIPSASTDANIFLDFSKIPNEGEGNIGDLMGQLAAYLQYLEYCVSLAEVDYEAWLGVYEFEHKKIMLTLPTERRDIMEARIDSQLESKKINLMTRFSSLKLLKAILEGKKRMMDTLSRELSRRSLVLQTQRSMM